MAKMMIAQTIKGKPAIKAKVRMKQYSKPKLKAKVPEKKDGQDKA